jgi:thymidylate synthase (FAD)
MRLIRPHYLIKRENDFKEATKEIELAARNCYKSEDRIAEGTDLLMAKKLITLGHEAMLEFGPSITVEFVCDRGVSHELVRHRLCSFAQESTRYCNYAKEEHVEFIIPPWVYITPCDYPITWKNKFGTCENEPIFKNAPDSRWFWSMALAERDYFRISEEGWVPQQARAVLPNSLKTDIYIKANIREWRHIFVQRTSVKAHPQMRELMIPLLYDFQILAPALFNDIIPQ